MLPGPHMWVTPGTLGTTALTRASKRVNYPGRGLAKQAKASYTENYRTLERELQKRHPNRWEDSVFTTGRLSTGKMMALPEAIFRLSTTPMKIPTAAFTEAGKPTLKFMWNLQGPRRVKIILKKQVNMREIHHEAAVIKIVWCWPRKGIEPRNKPTPQR